MTKILRNSAIITCSLLLFLGCEDKNSAKKEEKSDVQIANVTILPHACEPMQLTVDSGKTKFIITNKSNKPVEWEILKGVRIIDERENIIPGFKREITTFLDPGEYEMTCGLLSNPKGKLTVNVAKGASKYRKPTSVEYAGALAEYKVYTTIQTNDLLSSVKKMKDAIDKNDLKEAKIQYANSLFLYSTIESFLKQFGTLEQNIGANASLYKNGEEDKDFKGLHKLEIGLFKENSTKDLSSITEQLESNILKLKDEISKTSVTDNELLKYNRLLITTANDTKLKGLQNPYAKNDIATLEANVQGSFRIYRLIKSMLEKADPKLEKSIDKNYEDIFKLVSNYKEKDTYKSYETLTQTNKQSLEKLLKDLQVNLEKLPETLGIK